MSDPDLDGPATLRWIDTGPEDFSHVPGWHEDGQAFPTLRDALRFCIEELDLGLRNFATITLADGARLDPARIEALYRGVEV